jgi:radical SAM-linked protein
VQPDPGTPAEPRQRWRLTVRRAPDAPALTQRDLFATWDDAIGASGLPVASGDPAKPRPRLVFGAPLTVGMPSEGELIEITLTERLPAWHVRASLSGRLPDGWSLVDLADVWLGGPPLVGQVVAADYRVTIAGPSSGSRAIPDAEAIAHATDAIMAARTLVRERPKGDALIRYDLRPLVVDVHVEEPGPPVTIRIRARFHPELGTGRPEEVVLALAEELGTPLTIERIVRERLLLADGSE